jgi:hypothetical protein
MTSNELIYFIAECMLFIGAMLYFVFDVFAGAQIATFAFGIMLGEKILNKE